MKRSLNAWLWPMLGFVALSLLATFPTVARLGNFTVVATDSLLEAWTLKWDVHSLLGGSKGLGQLWNANMFYPYPDTLAFSEHLLPTAMLLLPFTLLGNTPMVAANLGVLLTTALSGLGMYLLVTWLTRNRWAGVLAGVFFAVAPFRMGHIIQLHLLSTHWIPFAFLTMARLFKLGRRRDLFLLILFTNLQFFSCINYAPLVAVALGLWALLCLVVYRRWSWLLLGQLALYGLVTAALNWPVLRLYQRVSSSMGVVRTLGDARVYGGSLANYTQPMANSLLYDRWLGLQSLTDSAAPGLVVFVLALLALGLIWRRGAGSAWRWWVLGLALLALVGMVMSFGANDAALGDSLAPVVGKWLPYVHLYDVVPLLQGLRVPLRFALLTTFALAVLAGIGYSLLVGWLKPGRRIRWMIGVLLPLLILVEHMPSPLPGETVAYGGGAQEWLADLPSGRVILQLPYLLHTNRSYLELDRVYQSAGHWQPMVNGGSGFKPPWLVEAGKVFETFPDAASLDLAQQLGVDYVVLQQDLYGPDAWANVTSLLPGYLPVVTEIHNVGDDLVLRLAPPVCEATADQVLLSTDGSGRLELANTGAAAFVADPRQMSQLTTTREMFFLEPLFVAPGQSVDFSLPATAGGDPWQAHLANLGRDLGHGEVLTEAPVAPDLSAADWQSLDIPFVNGAVLRSLSIGGDRQACGQLLLALQWESFQTGDYVLVTLADRFGRVVAETDAVPSVEGTSWHYFPLSGPLPAGNYSLHVQLLDSEDQSISAQSDDGTLVPELPGLPVVIRPLAVDLPEDGRSAGSGLANGATLLGVSAAQAEVRPGQWLRFSLYWHAQDVVPANFTVFTQLLGPDGQVWGQQDNPPRGGWYPTSLWLPGEVVRDDYAVRLDSAAPTCEYRLIVGMYDTASGQRAGVNSGPGAGGDFVPAMDVTVVTAGISQ